MPVIADVKRGDIGPVAAAYAEAHLGVYGATCVTVNPYMGEDAVLPFLEEARRQDRGGGVFVLVATSNPSSSEVQQSHGPAALRARRRAGRGAWEVERRLPRRGRRRRGNAARDRARVRELLPEALFLSPGYGAQGGDASGVRPLLDRHGGGVLVNSSRSILYAYETSSDGLQRRPPEKPPAEHETSYAWPEPTCRGGSRIRPANEPAIRSVKERGRRRGRHSTVAAATTTAKICTRLSLVILSFLGAGYGSVSGR